MAEICRASGGDNSKLLEVMEDFKASGVDAIVTIGYPATLAAKTVVIPTVAAAGVGDPVATGLVKSLAQPGGTVTGISDNATALSTKQLSLLKELLPNLRRVAMLWNADDLAISLRYQASAAAARSIGVTVQPLGVREPDIVAAIVADPVAVGFAATLERPGGNITGITSNDPSLGARQWEIFKQVVPKLARGAILSDSDIPGADASGLVPIERANVAAARAAGLTPQVVKVRGPAPDLDAAFKMMASEEAQALVILEVPVTIPLRKRIAELAAAYRIPTMFWGGASDAGGVFTYGTSFTDTFAACRLQSTRSSKAPSWRTCLSK